MNGLVELAKMLKERENKPYIGPQIGIVVSPPPDIKIQLGEIMLTKKHLIIAAHVLAEYERIFDLTAETVVANTNGVTVGDHGIHTYELTDLQATGTIKWTNTLQEGDEVILIPSTDGQKYYLIDKAVRL